MQILIHELQRIAVIVRASLVAFKTIYALGNGANLHNYARLKTDARRSLEGPTANSKCKQFMQM